MSRKFWSFQNLDQEERTLSLDGPIAEESWWGDEVTPAQFKQELNAGNGPLTVWINSPGGDVIAGAQIYNMIRDYPGEVTVKIDGIAASAASVIAMAGDKVLMSPVGLLMIHNPAMMAWGDSAEMKKAAKTLDTVKESIINAYELKTGLDRKKLSDLMDSEKWMDAKEAKELGFIDGEIEEKEKTKMLNQMVAYASRGAVSALMNKLAPKPQTFGVNELREGLKNFKC